MNYTFTPLPYPADALEPVIDKTTMEIHHGRHHKAYFDNFIAAIKDTPLADETLEAIFAGISKHPAAVRNNGGGVYNNNLSLDLNHVWTPTKQTRLSTDVIYAYADHNQEQQMVLHYVAPDGRELRPREGKGHSVFQKTNVWLVKTDLEAPLPASVRLETGAQLSGIRRDNNLRGLTLATADAWIDNPGQSNHFIYKEQIAGLYLNLSRAWGERELDVTAEELEQWLNVMGAAVLSVLSGYVVQTQLLGKENREAYFAYAAAILTQE